MRTIGSARPGHLRSSFHLSSLLAAGAISLAGLCTAGDACALSGTLTDAGATTTPRESSGAAGGATLIRTAASSSTSTSTAASTQQVTGPSETAASSPSSSSSSTTRTSGGTRRRAQTEEGGRRKGGTSTARTTSPGGKSVVDNKDRKTVAPVPAAQDRVHFSLSSGFETRYIFHGLDIIGFNSKSVTAGVAGDTLVLKPNSSSAIIYENADVAFAGAHVGLGYIRALSPTYPFFQSPTAGVPDAIAVPGVNHRRFYQEVDVSADYTASIVGGILDGTLGYNSYFFAYRDYKGASYQGEIFARLAYKQLKYVVPNFTFYRYVSNYNVDSQAGNLNGSYCEFRLDSAIPVYNKPAFGITIAPYAAAGYNISYLKYGNNDVGGWNDLELGLKIPTRIGQHFTVTPYGNYGLDISGNDSNPINNFSNNGFGERTHFWGGVTLAYSF